jgi:hypothetical protein
MPPTTTPSSTPGLGLEPPDPPAGLRVVRDGRPSRAHRRDLARRARPRIPPTSCMNAFADPTSPLVRTSRSRRDDPTARRVAARRVRVCHKVLIAQAQRVAFRGQPAACYGPRVSTTSTGEHGTSQLPGVQVWIGCQGSPNYSRIVAAAILLMATNLAECCPRTRRVGALDKGARPQFTCPTT